MTGFHPFRSFAERGGRDEAVVDTPAAVGGGWLDDHVTTTSAAGFPYWRSGLSDATLNWLHAPCYRLGLQLRAPQRCQQSTPSERPPDRAERPTLRQCERVATPRTRAAANLEAIVVQTLNQHDDNP